MNEMDEISFWINTKRAPCLFFVESVSSSKPESIHSVPDVPSPKKKKRKLTILDDESVLSEKHQNLYFDASQIKNQPVNGCTSSTEGSDIDFNIKKSSIQDKRKKCKLQRSSRTTLHKKNKLMTSTPKPQVLRRSLRKVQSSLINNSQLNTSSEILNDSMRYSNGIEGKKTDVRSAQKHCVGDQTVPRKSTQDIIARPIVANDKYEDLSDVSGFTANYIRSTKIHSKTPRKIKAKTVRNYMNESHQSPKEQSRMVICVNKSVNTGIPHNPRLNCSTDSSQNMINLVTVKNNSKIETCDKGTTLLKFVETKNADNNLDCSKETLDSTLSKTTTSRYPKRNKHIVNLVTINEKPNIDKRKSNQNTYNNSDRKENPEKLSRTRSGRNLAVRQKDNSVLVVNNSEKMSSTASINVASPANTSRKKRTPKQTPVRNSNNGRSHRESRDKSGFAQCFSDSDDNEPRKQKKYFC